MSDKNTKKKYRYHKGSFVIGKKPDGSPDRIYVSGKTKRERDEKLAEAKRLHGIGVKLGNTLVRDWGHIWITTYKADASPKQKKHYQAKLNYDILPAIGNMRMVDVRASHLKDLLNSYSGGRRGTVVKIRLAVRQLFADAAEEGIIERNPAAQLKLPDTIVVPRRPLTIPEREAVLKVATTHQHGRYFRTLLHTGIRTGECIALVKSDVNLKAKKLTISKSIEFDGNVGSESTTKAEKLRNKKNSFFAVDVGVRVVPIPDILLPDMISLCEGKDATDLLFPSDDGKIPTLGTMQWWWGSFERQCHIATGAKIFNNQIQLETSYFGADVTPHFFRHTYGTDLYAAGVDYRARQEFLGHAITDVTGGYTGMTDVAFKRNLKLLNKYYNQKIWGKNGETEKNDKA